MDLGYDPYQATMLVTEVMKEGIVTCTEVRPTVLNFSQPMKHLDGLMRSGGIAHDGDPLMTWMVGNVTALVDAKDNVYPRKERPENKIDGVVALLMALARMLQGEENGVSVYEGRGLAMVG
jgi:phage terminase large subunit-like protein